MRFIGDVHGHIGEYLRVRGEGPSFQIGDMGVGFPGRELPEHGRQHRFIRGNHDDPAACRTHSSYAGEYGFDSVASLFFLGGAFSIDWEWRKIRMRHDPTPIWWPDEELSEDELEKASKLFATLCPEIVATHDCPSSVSERILGKMLVGFRPEKLVMTRTGKWLQTMFEAHQPRLWLFGHYHVDVAVKMNGTEFVCLNELSVRDV
jgi:hypothetical protein